MQDADDVGDEAAAEAGFSGGGRATTTVSFSQLYGALGASLNNERTALLLYDALHACPHFQNYVLVRRRVHIFLPCHEADGWAGFKDGPCC